MRTAMLSGFKPAIETTPSIRPHRTDLNVIWFGSATYSLGDIETMVRDMMLAVAEQRRRAWALDSQLNTEGVAS